MSTTTSEPKTRRALPQLMQLTEAAAARLKALYEGGEAGKLLRIAVSTKGCSGMSYEMEWVEAPTPQDEVVIVRVVSAPHSTVPSDTPLTTLTQQLGLIGCV